MNKPLTMIIKDTKTKLASVCNESGLSPVILDLIVQGIYSEIHYLAEKQVAEEESAYLQSLKKDVANGTKGDDNEQKAKEKQ